MCQSVSRRGRTMLRFPLLLVILTHPIRTIYVTDRPSFADRLGRMFEKLERVTFSPVEATQKSHANRLYEKLDRLNSLTPDENLTDEEMELLSAMRMWGVDNPKQLEGVAKDFHLLRMEAEDEKNERIVEEDSDVDWNDDLMDLPDQEFEDYVMDGSEGDDWEEEADPSSTSKPMLLGGVTPSAYTRYTYLSAIDPIAATNERPRILDDVLSPSEEASLKQMLMSNIRRDYKANRCFKPQPRWLSVRQMAPAADTVYIPPCVQLYRCAPDTGCCNNETEVCAPVEGRYVVLPFYLSKATQGNLTLARMVFYNHTRCGCVSREAVQSAKISRGEIHLNHIGHEAVRTEIVRERQNDWRVPTEEPKLEVEEEPTAPPQLRRCTCPGLFIARISDKGVCSCLCDWKDLTKRRDCLLLARGKEHFGMRDRVCVLRGDCTPPTCDYGLYDRSVGRCPQRKFRRIKYHAKRYQPDKSVVL